MNEIGHYIKSFREKRFTSQREFARKAGISNATVSRLEEDRIYVPTIQTLYLLEKYIGISRYELLDMYIERIKGR